MNTLPLLRFGILVLSLGFGLPAAALAQSTAFTYQGSLQHGANPATGTYDLRFVIYDAASAGAQSGPALTNTAIAVSNGLFTVVLNFGSDVFTGAARWLEVGVRTNGSGAFTSLTPRQPVTPTPYAMHAAFAGDIEPGANVSFSANGVVSFNAPTPFTLGPFATNLVQNLNAQYLAGRDAGQFWWLGGNSGQLPGDYVLGTLDNSPLEFQVNGQRALRVEPSATSPNLIGGYAGNVVSNGFAGAVIAGGGQVNNPNRVGANFASVLGGYNNTAAGFASTAIGLGGVAQGDYSTVIGVGNSSLGAYAMALGVATVASGNYSLALGLSATASGYAAAVGGGQNNIASGDYATIPGGQANTAAGSYALAAGRRAKANHSGTFVWADSTDADFTSTGSSQYLIRAGGGVGINTNNPGTTALTVRGATKVDGSFIGGDVGNVISNGVQNGFIGGGGSGGFENRVGGNFAAIAGGVGNRAYGQASFAAGENNSSSGRGAVALGWGTVASSDGSVALGVDTISSGLDSVALGYRTRATNDNATALGQSTLAGGWDSLAWGTVTVAGGHYSTAGGYYAQANHPGSFVWADSTSSSPFATTGNHQFLIRAGGGVGINTANPAGATLAVNGTARVNGGNNWNVTGTEGDFRVGNDSYRFKIGIANAGGGAGDVWMRAQGGLERINIKAPAGTRILSNEAESAGVSLAPGGTSWAMISDRNVKKDFAPVDGVAVLEKLAALPITQWRYNWETAEVTPHIGPMAQDFKAAFYPGADDKVITTQETDGVALAAIQGLNAKVESGKQKAETRMEQLEAENAALKARLEQLEQLVMKRLN